MRGSPERSNGEEEDEDVECGVYGVAGGDGASAVEYEPREQARDDRASNSVRRFIIDPLRETPDHDAPSKEEAAGEGCEELRGRGCEGVKTLEIPTEQVQCPLSWRGCCWGGRGGEDWAK